MNTISTIFTIFLICTLLTFSTLAHSQAQRFNFPGGIIDLRIAKQHDDLPEVKFGLREPAILEEEQHWRILIGVDLDTLSGEYLVYVKPAINDTTGQHYKFNVAQRNYPLLKIKNKKLTDIYREHTSLSSIGFTNTQQPSLPLRYPAEGKWVDYFGHLAQDTRSGTLLAQNLLSLTTTDILTVNAPQNAIVSKIETDEYQISTVYLDHGRGLYSVLSGLSDLSIKPGNGVVAGAVIGKLPSHIPDNQPKQLSWQCILNGVYVNPIILTQI